MRYKAIKSFSGVVTASTGSTIELEDTAVIKDLVEAGYIEPMESEAPKAVASETKPTAKATAKKAVTKKAIVKG